jgi:membrane protease subunit (stomatin/prohibitin family)
MALFGKKTEGGLMDVIRCDETDYLIWKWRPVGQPANTTRKENSIRWGSSLRVKDGEVAVFVYKQKDGVSQDFIEGPFDETIKTANFPVLTNIIGMAYAGQSPFQAEVYFINLAGNIRQEFGVPMFDVADPRFGDITVRVGARGSLVFKIEDYRGFIKLHRLVQFDLAQFKVLVRDAVIKYVKNAIANAPSDHGLQVVQIERKLVEINNLIEPGIRTAFGADFGVKLVRFDLAVIEIEKDEDYERLRSITSDIEIAMRQKQNAINMRNLDATQEINAENMRETLAINRNAAEEFQRLQTQTNFIQAHQMNRHADVLITAADSLGAMGNVGVGGAGVGGFNPAGVMTGLALGGAMGNQMANMTNAAGQSFQQPQSMPPPMPQVQYNVSVEGRSAGPFMLAQLKEMARSGQLRRDSMVWKAGMPAWAAASAVDELAALFVPEAPPLGPYHVAVGGQNQGPFDFAQMRAMAAGGQLRADSMVWRAGLEQWEPAVQVSELATLFTAPAGPPPVPPGAGMPPPLPGAA